jgi:hypothetical protein
MKIPNILIWEQMKNEKVMFYILMKK